MVIKRFDVYLVTLEPTVGTEIRKTRPCVVVSPNEMNSHLQTVIVAPMTTRRRTSPTRIPCRFQSKSGDVVLDQIRIVDRMRLVKRLGRLSNATGEKVLEVLHEIFAS